MRFFDEDALFLDMKRLSKDMFEPIIFVEDSPQNNRMAEEAQRRFLWTLFSSVRIPISRANRDGDERDLPGVLFFPQSREKSFQEQ